MGPGGLMVYTTRTVGNKFRVDNVELCFGQYDNLKLHYSVGAGDFITSHGTADIIFIGAARDMPYIWLWAPVK